MFSDETDSPSKRRKRRIYLIESSDDSDSDSSFERIISRKKKPKIFSSDSDSSDSDMVRVPTLGNVNRIVDELFSDSSWSSDTESCITTKSSNASTSKLDDNGAMSDSSNSHSEKCPICLLSFKGQEIGSPESCDHVFCAVCIEEWAKNVNTCPIDRLSFGMIMVRDKIEGELVRQVLVDTPARNSLELVIDMPFDLTMACEFCGSTENEHTMLLCDGCNLGFHMECLEPPLTELPDGDWYCSTCERHGVRRSLLNETNELENVHGDDFNEGNRGIARGRNENTRWFPRTSQTERAIRRVRQRIYNIVQEFRTNRPADTDYALELRTENRNHGNSQIRRPKKKKSTKRKSKRERRAIKANKNSKTRLAAHLGIRNYQGQLQNAAGVASNQNPLENISFQRRMAGIPQLHLFGRQHELDYFSSSDSENNNESFQSSGSASCLLLTPLGRPSTSQRRNLKAKVSSVTSTNVDLLGSILECQAKFHSNNYTLSLTDNGRIKLDRKNSTYKTKQTPLVTESDSTTPSSTNRSGTDGDNASSPRAQSTNDYHVGTGTSVSGFARCSTPVDGDQVPIDYSLPQSYETNNKDEKKKDKDLYNPEEANSGASDSELDIYSDIETVTTSRTEDADVKTPIMQHATPGASSALSVDDNNENESDTDLIIDDTEKIGDQDKYDPACVFESDDEKTEAEPAVTSTVDSTGEGSVAETLVANVNNNSEIQSNTVQSSSSNNQNALKESDDEELLEDDCPNFNIYSTESINMAKSNDLAMMVVSGCKGSESITQNVDNSPITDIKTHKTTNKDIDTSQSEGRVKKCSMSFYGAGNGLYSDSDDENVIKIDRKKPFGISDLQTEDISEEERSYTPCLDEKEPQQLQEQHQRQGLEGLDTEMISDDDKNDFDDANDPKATSDGDALEINAKESELDFSRPEECEEGEIVDKTKKINNEEDEEEEARGKGSEKEEEEEAAAAEEDDSNKENEKQKKDCNNDGGSTNNVAISKEQGIATFKKISKSQRERNYRENRSRSRSRSRENKKNKTNTDRKERRKRKEIEIYNVRSILSDKPRRVKDQFGRDISRRLSDSDSSSRSLTPPPQSPLSGRRPFQADSSPLNVTSSRLPARSRSRSLSSFHTPNRRRSRSRSYSPAATLAPRRSLSRGRRSRSKDKKKRKRTNKSRSTSRERRRSCNSGRKKSVNRSRSNKEKKRRKSSPDRYKVKGKKARSRSLKRQRSSSPRSPSLRRRDWERRNSRGWTPSLSPSSPPSFRRLSPSWTPPRLLNQPPVKPQNLTVILTNDANKKSKKDKKKKSDKRGKDIAEKSSKKRKRDKSPAPSKEVFASGNNILVSVSFNKDADNIRDVQASRRRYETTSELTTKRLRKEREKKNNTISTGTGNNNKNATLSRSEKTERKQKMANVKPVAIIDLELSPFRELTPSPQDIIVLTDSENGDSNDHILGLQKNVIMCDSSSQQISSPPPPTINAYNSAGPKTPPEPQVKFSLSSKQSQMRPIINPLHEPDDVDDEPVEPRCDEEESQLMHKGPNTPPEPPNSPPSSPDAYDPFDPTKSRTPTPEPAETTTQSNNSSIPGLEDTNIDGDKLGGGGGMVSSATPPDVRPADSQSSLIPSTPDAKTSPERSIGVIINQVVVQNQQQTSTFLSSQQQPLTVVAPSSMITSTPMSAPRINILSSAILPSSNVSSSVMAQRIVMPTTSRSSPVNKVSPSKMSNKGGLTTAQPLTWKDPSKKDATNIDFDSPYSPGSSDYEDLFEPPPETGSKSIKTSKVATATTTVATTSSKAATSKNQSAFDQLFGSSPQPPQYKVKNKGNKPTSKVKPSKTSSKPKPQQTPSKGTKLVGVKMDEDNLKILDELPNSAVEMQVKDKFLKKLNRQERVVEEVKLVLKPHYNKKHVTKEEYKDILRRAVPKICHNKSGEINPKKIQTLIEAYVRKVRHSKKVTSSSSVNPQKTQVISNWLSKIN